MKTAHTTTRNWNVHVLLHDLLQQQKGEDRRHFHQLFRQLRLANKSSHWELVDEDLGHFDNLLGDPDIVRCEDIDQQLFFHQRHRNIEHWWENGLFHGAPLDPLLRPDLHKLVRPGAPRGRQVIHVHWTVQCACRLGRGMRPERGRVVHLEIPLPGPCHHRSPWS